MTDTCIAFGRFDGVHIGHRALLRTLIAEADRRGLRPVLLCEQKSTDGGILTTQQEMRHLLSAFPIDAMVSIDKADMTAERIAAMATALGAKALVMGEHHKMLDMLQNMAGTYSFDVVKCDAVRSDGEPVHARRIAALLCAGNLEAANRLLGHPYIIAGNVVKGRQLGRTVGLPTANIDFSHAKKLPMDGSYVTITTVDGVRRVGLTNIGKRPTVDSFDFTTIENHILDFAGDLYGKALVVELHRFIRGVDKFDSLSAMQAQVAQDVQSIRDYIESIG